MTTPRPFYGQFAWAYEYLIERPGAGECAAMASTLSRRGVGAGASILDAGCGTGRYAVELARLGYRVTGIDRSAEMLALARARPDSPAGVTYEVGDITALPGGRRFDAVLCRGVLNDLVDDEPRAAVFDAFARVTRPGGVLLLDARDWETSAAQRAARPIAERRVSTPRGLLAFRTVTRLDPTMHRLLLSETHALETAAGEHITASDEFVMRCWTREELESALRRTGFEALECSGAYDGAPLGTGDRIVVAATRTSR
ncbi:MAG TPA: class I SAM-dependent methyltransferase [Methylomirabilota bacterium]|nr:class I SAM-dependent methyltransferase [Methylomirabilota bacterium]